MKYVICTATMLVAGIASSIAWSADPVATTATEINWGASAVTPGGQIATLWGDSQIDQGALLKWPSRTKLKPATFSYDMHIVVMTGTFTIGWDEELRELGPGGYVSIPRGTAHVLGCEAAGECLVFMYRSAGK